MSFWLITREQIWAILCSIVVPGALASELVQKNLVAALERGDVFAVI